MVHEHVFIDATPLLRVHGYRGQSGGQFALSDVAEARWNPGAVADNYRLTDVDLAVEELKHYRRAGGATIVDATPANLGRDPLALREASDRTGLHIVMGAGYYLEATHSDAIRDADPYYIAETIVGEFESGVGDTNIRPGHIGEIGTGDPVTSEEKKVLRGAAIAARSSGLALSVHLHPWSKHGHAVLDVIEEEGLSPERVLLNHVTTAIDDPRYLKSLLQRGSRASFDLFGFDHSLLSLGRYPPSDWDTVRAIITLIDAGWTNTLFVSQDVGVKTRLRKYAGWGYAHILNHVVPLILDLSNDEAIVDALLRSNPQSMFEIRT